MPAKEWTREEVIAMQAEKDAALPEIEVESMPKEQRDTAIVALRVAGLTYADIAQELGLSERTIGSVLSRNESKQVMRLVRDAAKLEAVVQGLRIQRRYLDKLETLPVDRAHAATHSQIAAAFGKIFDKAALASGEATERTESKHIALNIDMKKEMYESLREAQELRFERERVAGEFAQPSDAAGDSG